MKRSLQYHRHFRSHLFFYHVDSDGDDVDLLQLEDCLEQGLLHPFLQVLSVQNRVTIDRVVMSALGAYEELFLFYFDDAASDGLEAFYDAFLEGFDLFLVLRF